MENFLRIDEKENAIDSLQKATKFLKNTESDPLYWKWFIVAIHHAIYHFMLLALQNTDQSGIWKEPEKLVDYGLSRKVVDTENSKNRLVTFLEAFDRIQEKDRMSGYVNAKPFIAETKHKEAANCLNTILRNNFTHFSPRGWSIEILFIIDAISPMLDVIEFLVFNSGRLFFDEQQRNNVQSYIAQIRLFFNDRKVLFSGTPTSLARNSAMNLSIIYQDNDIIAVNKPAGIAVHKGIAEKGKTVTDWLIEKFPEIRKVGDEPELRPGIVHRLDKDTSGVLVVAKNQKAFEFLKKQFQNREVVKKYLALVEGNLKTNKGMIDLAIGRSGSDFRKKLASEKARGELREAVTEYKVLEKLSGYTLIEAYPKTGRTHQIRVHFKAIGHPIVCDPLYGGKRMTCPSGLKRHFLHANFLEFISPSGARLKLEADLSEDLSETLERLRKK